VGDGVVPEEGTSSRRRIEEGLVMIGERAIWVPEPYPPLRQGRPGTIRAALAVTTLGLLVWLALVLTGVD
jgi:hypothetical protein